MRHAAVFDNRIVRRLQNLWAILPAPTLAVLLLVVSEGCSEVGPETVLSVSVTPSGASLSALGETLQYSAAAQDPDGTPVSGVNFTWATSSPSIVSISPTGLATAVGNGFATITATATGMDRSGSVSVGVIQLPVELAFSTEPAGGRAEEPLGTPPVVEIRDKNGNRVANDNETAVSIAIGSNPGGATLSGKTVVRASAGQANFLDLGIRKPGNGYTLTASAFGLGSVTSGLFDVDVNVASIEVSPATIVLTGIGEQEQLFASALSPSGAEVTGVSFVWESSDEAVATVGSEGTVSAVGEGSAWIEASFGDTSDSASVTVQLSNQRPIANIDEPSQDTTVTLGDAVDFRGSASDPDGTISSHAWVMGDGSSAAVEDPGLHTYATAGTYTVTYEVTDDDGATSSPDTVTVTVEEPANQAPTARITRPSQDTTVTLGDPVDFRGSASDPDGTISSHAWDWDDGSGANVEDPGSHTYAAAGTYTVTYEVTDNDGAKSSPDTVIVTVSEGASAISVSPHFTVLRVSGTVALTVTVFDGSGNIIPSPTFQVMSRNPAVVTTAGADLMGQSRGVTDVVVTSGSVADSARIAVVVVSGFAAMLSTSSSDAEISAAPGSTLVLDLWMIRPPGGTGDLGSISGTLQWDAGRLSYVSSENVEAGFTWVPNETNAGAGTLTFGSFSAAGASNTFVLARVTFDVGGSTGGAPVVLDLDVSAAGTIGGTNITDLVEAVDTSVKVQ